MIHLVTFSTPDMSRARARCVSSAHMNGVVITHPFEPHMLPLEMQQYCEGKRGFGYWQWKPMIVQMAMRGCVDGDILIYSDAGVEFINNVNYIIDRMDQDIFLFGNNWEHAHWCKRDVIEAIWPWRERGRPTLYQGDEVGDRVVNVFVGHEPRGRDITIRELAWERFRKQVQASVIFFRVSDYSRRFVAEWLKWCLHRERFSTICSDEWRYLIDDSPSKLTNHPEFREHRHDQAILTTLAYREGIRLHWWPSVYNKGGSPEFVYEKLPEYAADNYPVVFSHHRRRNHEWSEAA